MFAVLTKLRDKDITSFICFTVPIEVQSILQFGFSTSLLVLQYSHMLVLEKNLQVLDEFNPINFIIYEVIKYSTTIGFVANGSIFRIIAA